MTKNKIVYPLLFLIFLVILVELGVNLLNVPDYILPSPTSFLDYYLSFITSSSTILDIIITLQEIIIGVFWGIILGTILGYGMAKITLLNNILMPILLIFQIAPKISLAPLFILWFGLGSESKVVLIILVVIFPILTNIYTSLKSIDSEYYDLMKILKATKYQRLKIIELPLISFGIISASKTSVTQALTAAVIGEMMGANAGLGYLITYGNEMQDIYIILSAVLTLAIIGYLLFKGAEMIEQKLNY